MSLLRRSARGAAAGAAPQTPPLQVVSSELFFNIQPQTHPGVTPTAAKLRTATTVMTNMNKQCADLFSINPGVRYVIASFSSPYELTFCLPLPDTDTHAHPDTYRSFQNGGTVFHTSQLYGESVSCEELSHNLSTHGLCLAISASVPNKTTTLAMLDASHLTPEACQAGFVKLPTGSAGSMVVSFRPAKNGLHYVHSIDYHVN